MNQVSNSNSQNNRERQYDLEKRLLTFASKPQSKRRSAIERPNASLALLGTCDNDRRSVQSSRFLVRFGRPDVVFALLAAHDNV